MNTLRKEIFHLASQIKFSRQTLWHHSFSDKPPSQLCTLNEAFDEAQTPTATRNKIIMVEQITYSAQEKTDALAVIEILRRWRDEDRALGLIDW